MMELDLTTPEGRKKQGELILRAIREAGLSVEQVAKDIGCSRALLYQYIAGTTLAQPDKLTLIARRTGKPLAYFYGADLAAPEDLQAEREALARARTEWERQQAEERERRLRERLDSLFALAEAQLSPPDWRTAASTYEQVLPIARELGDNWAEAIALFRLGNLRLLMGDLDGALFVLRQAQALFERLGEAPYALACRQSIGRALLLMGHPEEARQQFELVARSGNWHNRWEATVALAAVAEWTGDFKSAMVHLDNAEELSRDAPAERDAQTVRLFVTANRANVYLACGDFAEAAKLAKEAFNLAEQLGDRDQQLEALLTFAVCQRFLGAWVLARENASRARMLALFAGDHERVIVAETVLAQLSSVAGDFAGAKNWAKGALAEALRSRSRRAELWAHKALAETYLREESADDALYHAQLATELSETMRHATEFAHSLCLRSWANLLAGKPEEARRDAERAFNIADEKGMRHIAALACWLLAQTARKPDAPQSREWLGRAEQLAREVGDAELVFRCLVLKGQWALETGDWQGAEKVFAQAHPLLEQWRGEWRRAGLDDTWLEDPQRFRFYLDIAKVLARRKSKEAADAFVEAAGWLPLKEAWTSVAETVQRRKRT
ncbi:MAG: hypothetical protein IMHGJWDQ_000023 [Candidatus Fervidibacter sp.]